MGRVNERRCGLLDGDMPVGDRFRLGFRQGRQRAARLLREREVESLERPQIDHHSEPRPEPGDPQWVGLEGAIEARDDL